VNNLLAVFRQAAWEQSFVNGKVNEIPSLLVTDPIEQGNLLALEAANGTVEIACRPLLKAMEKVATELIPDELRERITKDLTAAADFQAVENIRLAQAIHLRAQEVTSSHTLGDLHRLETDALKEINRGLMAEFNACLMWVYGGQEPLPIPVAWEPDEGLQSYKVLASGIRRHLYPYLASLTGIDLFSAESARIFREGVFRTYCEHVAPAQQERRRKGYLRYVLTGSRYWRHPFWKRIWISNPTGYFNELFRSGVGSLSSQETADPAAVAALAALISTPSGIAE